MKGQSQVVSAVIVILLVSAAVATILPWGSNIIQKKKDTKSLDDAYNFFLQLDRTVRDVAKNGGEQTLNLDVPGVFEVFPANPAYELNNSMVFYFKSKATNIASDNWIPLNTPNINEKATLSIDTPSVIFGKSNKVGEEMEVRYRLWYRELYDENSGHGYRIILKTSDDINKATTSGFLKIQRLNSETIGGVTFTYINIIV